MHAADKGVADSAGDKGVADSAPSEVLPVISGGRFGISQSLCSIGTCKASIMYMCGAVFIRPTADVNDTPTIQFWF